MKWFANLKVATKLLAGFLSVAVIAGVIGAVGVLKIRQIDAADTRLYEKITVPLGTIGDIAVAFQRIRINVRDALEATDPTEEQARLANVLELRDSMTKNMALFEKSLITEEGRRLFAEFSQAREAYVGYVNQMVELKKAHRSSEALAILHGPAKKAAMTEQALIEKLVAAKEHQGKLTSENNSAIAHAATWLMTVLAVVGTLLAVGLGILISRVIVAPLNKAVSAADRLATGDLTVEIEATTTDEPGQLLASMQHMVAGLRDLVSQTVSISASIASASTQLQATSEQIATGAEEVASQARTVATASEEMAATSSSIAQNCTVAAEASQSSTHSANAGADVVQQTITGMGAIADRVRQSSKTVEALGARSEQIGDIVGTIEDIADQTNLLALNAAIEAARAGEQGRGFAVVADEVRALAERTTRATKEIGEMIKGIQQETRHAVRAMEEGVNEVEKGAVSAQKSGEALEEILGRIQEVSLQVSQIATAAEQQTAATGEVTTNIQQITEVVHDTAKGAEETAEAAGQLARQADDLQSLVGRFRLS
ncbi:methyl-accepting chemotaxis protein [Geomesophilobacter sediminis]|uniref:Methyl-accepting chemotaxis protein n=1 Tax=Geomesophilobacter sediminis TaxID=2798584 RepID=A0A8J7IZI8_9BACT|nr:methyl-accepting chemotaxis protein [Geomesophilobacter sediminis]MBJ6725492.1 methyl-accepting chemotaxis protein [Geomesophilobacter sediminis]